MNAERERGKILVVDDSAVNRKLLSQRLAMQGHAVETANDGQEALAALKAAGVGPFDLVLLDIVMPVMDGYQALAAIKADASLERLPVIVITSVEEIDSAVRCIRMGATDYLPKPFDGELLKARVDVALTAKRSRDRELLYLEHVGIVTEAAEALEEDRFTPGVLDEVRERQDALGRLAQVFRDMAIEVQAREARMRRQVQDLRIEIDETRRVRKVEEITSTAYFHELCERAADLRRLLGD